MSNTRSNKFIKYSLICLVVFILAFVDQITKYLVVNKLDLSKRYSVVKGIISFEYLENRGVAFGLFSGRLNLITILTVVIVLAIIYVIFILDKAINNNPNCFKKFTMLQFVCAALIAGAIGNSIDRIRLGYVVDFISTDFIEFPTFNVADCYVTVGAAVLFVVIMFFISDDEFDSIKMRENDK